MSELANNPLDEDKSLELIEIKEVLALLLKARGIHEGLYTARVQFQIGLGQFGVNPQDVYPTAMIGVSHIGFSEVKEMNPLTVDASIVNP
ncbi:MAG: hypothetical protein KGI50_07225, partial [Patescibacteria group bacterium]|nr:hypothetical protein [Patescibacteria group bacterium]